MTPAFLDLPSAVELIADSDRVGVGGALFSRLPLALVGELARSGRGGLTYVTWGGGLPLELLLQADAVAKVVFCFSSLDVFGLAPRFRSALEEGRVEVEELPALAMAQGFEAALQRLPSLPFQLPVGSDILDRSSVTRIAPDPVGGGAVGSAAALHLDSFLLHAQRADAAGNVELAGTLGMDLTAPFAARNLIVSVEEVVPAGALQADRRGQVIPHHFVRCIVESPHGAYPSSCLPYYTADFGALREAFERQPLALPEPGPERLHLVRAAATVDHARLARHRFTRAAPPGQSDADVMAVCLAREYADESICSAGAVSPLAMTSYLLARRTHAPGLTLITTSGGYVDVAPRPMLLGVGEALDYKSAAQHASGDGTYHRYYQSGRITHETVATAQVDRFGRTNTIQVRSPSGRIVRLPGQGGMADVSNLHQHFLLYVPRHSPLSLVENVDVSSAARALLTDDERLAAGLRPGVVKVVTNLCVFELDHATRQLQLVALHPSVEIGDVERETGFDVIRSPSLERTPPPTESELELLATEIDPLGIRHLEFVPARERGAYLAEVIAAEERLVRELAGREGVSSAAPEELPDGTDELLSVATAGAYLQARKVLPAGEPVRVAELGGGVSNIVLAVSCGAQRVVVKQALPRLRVEAEWLAKRERAVNEARALKLAHAVTPGRVPALLDVDEERCALTIAAAPSGWITWKERLLDGDGDPRVARTLGEILAAWHGATFRREELSQSESETEVFDQLRIDPYYRTVAHRRPELAEAVDAYIRRLVGTRVCIVHGDYSPKNVLVGDGLWVIDFEVAHFGDPAFDLAFMLNHLLLKRLHRARAGGDIDRCVTAFWDGYSSGVPEALRPDPQYVLGHVGCLMVARVDGKSPVEYLSADGQAAARALGSRLLLAPPGSLEDALALPVGRSG